MVFQSPGGFEATQKGYLYQRAREVDKRLARRTIQGERQHPETNALWFFMPEGSCPTQWYDQWNTGSLNHIASIHHKRWIARQYIATVK